MNLFKKFRSALSRCLEPKRNKNGSSLAFVMVVGAVLVIWVLCIMPLMTAVGTNGIAMSGSYSDYLQSRSAIEFCKSELEKIVETDPPKTFAVIKTGNTYSVAYKRVDGKNVDTTQPTSYGNLINYSGDDKTDTPKDNSVVAICAVVKDPDKSEYNITITTYNDGKPGLTYSTVYTIRGTLKINPESYLKSQALPLSDFVVVDGKLGATTLWNSTIHSLTFDTSETNNVTNLSAIRESLLLYSENADAGPFPAVFKTTVFPAASTAPTEPDYTSDTWTIPNPVDKNKNDKKNGDIWFEKQNNNKIKVYIRTSTNSKQELGSSDYKLYVNGTYLANDKAASTSNIHQISVDYYGSTSNKILPANGLVLGYIGSPISSNVNKHTAPVKTSVTVDGTNVTIASNNSNNGVIYGFCTVDEFPNVTWKTKADERTFQLSDENKAYYFFAYRPESYQNGAYYAASDVTYMGYVYPITTTTQLQANADYLIVSKDSSGNYYALVRNSNSITQQSIGSLPALITSTPSYSDNYQWHVESNNNTFIFKNKGNSKYLSLSGNAERYWDRSWKYKWNFYLTLADNSTNASFNYGNNMLYRNITSNGTSTTGYIKFESGKFKAANSGSEIFFVKIPVAAPAEPDMTQLKITSNLAMLQADKITYGTPISSVISGTYNVKDLRANGSKINGNLNVGKYNITLNSGNGTRNLGMIEVTKASLTGNLTVEATNNDHNVTIEIKAKNVVEGGERWIGYRTAGTYGDYKWFPADNNDSYTFTLSYGSYEFVARESGNNNYNPAQSSPIIVELKAPELEDTSTPSLMMGSSLYFMGRNGSIDTQDATIYLHTDLIVLRHDIMGSGSVVINPYSQDLNTYDPNDTAPDTLLFAVNDIKNASSKVVFKALTFYRIPAGTDINEITDTEAVNLHPLNINNDIDKLKLLLRSEDYPEINMDIAYIDRENNKDKSNDNQLAHIVSGETIGWTENGTLIGGDDENYNYFYEEYTSRNRQFVVCAYVSEVKDTTISRTANRILIAAAEELNQDGTKSMTLKVPDSLTFTCRYFSITADSIIQDTNSGSLKIANLGQDSSFWGDVLKWLSLSQYSSKSLQVDFERTTNVHYSGGDGDHHYSKQGIFRLDTPPDEGLDLFSAYEVQPLMVTYTNNEIKGWLGRANNDIRIVDRYLTLTSGGLGDLIVESFGESKLDVYSNYLYIDKSVNSYTFDSSIVGAWGGAKTDFRINSQERGYKSEYLGFFTHNSSETYNGTIVYIAPNDSQKALGADNGGVTIKKVITIFGIPVYSDPEFIPSGFYFIPAKEGGTSITALTDLGVENNTDGKPWAIDPDKLSQYSIYIKQDGTLSDAYVDTGLIGNGDLGESGFSGGNVG